MMEGTGTGSEPWLVKIPAVLVDATEAVWRHLRVVRPTPLSPEWHLVKVAQPGRLWSGPAELAISWRMRVEHSWPCAPRGMEGFIEKAAQALLRKFGARKPQAVLMGPLDAGSRDPFFRGLASNLRGRTLQLFGPLESPDAESQDPEKESLYCLVGPGGLYAGMIKPREAGGFHPGGTKFIRQEGGETISRAGAKIAEALHWLRLYRPVPKPASHWLELGASPGGMTAELLRRKYRVTAVDRAPLDPKLRKTPGLRFYLQDCRTWRAPAGTVLDAVLCDMNGPAEASFATVLEQARALRAGGIVLFTVKTAGLQTIDDAVHAVAQLRASAERAGLASVAVTHLMYNRREFTAVWERPALL
ncbi:MAG: SAM-dependent methyltransferase [Verrucomicrobiota bacterium]|jgi:23S rRNA (cytidine2498-2'-O)-methyltransferase